MTEVARQISIKKSNTCFLFAFGLLNVLAFTLLFCGLSFLAGLTISKWQFPVAGVSALITNYYAARFLAVETKTNLKINAAILGLLAASVIFSGFFYDVSSDGQYYHMETVIRLKQGYNPVKQPLPIPADEIWENTYPVYCTGGADKPLPYVTKSDKPSVNIKYLNINSLCAGAETIEAAIYKITNRVETAKAINVIGLLAAFFLCLSLFYKIGRISNLKKWLLALLLTFNPITIIQLNSFCVDGDVACWLLCLVVISCLLFMENNRFYQFLLASIIMVAINFKFTSLVFAAMYCAAFLIVLLIYKKIDLFKKVLITGMLSAFIGIICCGFHPYGTNVIRNHNVFYGLDDTRAEIRKMTPPLFLPLNRFEKLFLSLSTHEGWDSADKKSVSDIPKMPFIINMKDIHAANDTLQKFAGFGPFFSGELLIAVILFLITLIKFRRELAFKYALALILIIFATVAVIPDSWWNRFVPQLWLIPVVILCMAEFITIRHGRLLKGILYISIGMNVAWGLLAIVFNIFSTARVNYQMTQLKALNQPVNIEYCSFESYRSNRVRFEEVGIFITEKNVAGPYIYNVEDSNTRFETPSPLPELPKPFLMRWSERMKSGR